MEARIRNPFLQETFPLHNNSLTMALGEPTACDRLRPLATLEKIFVHV